MPINRLTHLFDHPPRRPARKPVVDPGFSTVPLKSMPEVADQCNAMRSVYEMAYLFARMGYVVEE